MPEEAESPGHGAWWTEGEGRGEEAAVILKFLVSEVGGAGCFPLRLGILEG